MYGAIKTQLRKYIEKDTVVAFSDDLYFDT